MKYEVLDTTNFQNIFENALHLWRQYSDDEELHPSDVSYTLLEMMAMLTDMLNYYMEQITEEHIKAYQQLQKKSSKTSCILPVQLKNKEKVHKGDVFYLYREQRYLPYEIQETMNILPGEIQAIFYHRGQDYHKIDHLLHQEEGIFSFPVNHDGELIFLTSHAFDCGSTYSIYVTCTQQRQYEATYKKPSFAIWKVSIYTSEGWIDGELLEDDTCGFLYSGFLTFRFFHQQMSISYAYEQAYVFRFTYTHAMYDQMPALRSVQLSVLKVLQQEHITRTYDFQCIGHKNEVFMIEENIMNMDMLAFIEDKQKAGLFHPIKYTLTKQSDHIEVQFHPPYVPSHIRFMCSYEHSYDSIYTGVSSQRISLKDGAVDDLLFQTSRGYQRITCYSKSDPVSYGYGCWKHDDALCFGNGRDFKVMEKGSILYGNLRSFRCQKAPEATMSEADVLFLMLNRIDQVTLPDVIQTQRELEFTILNLPHLAIEEVLIDLQTSDVCKVYVKNKTGYYIDWYFLYIKAEIIHRLPIGMQVEVYPIQQYVIEK